MPDGFVFERGDFGIEKHPVLDGMREFLRGSERKRNPHPNMEGGEGFFQYDFVHAENGLPPQDTRERGKREENRTVANGGNCGTLLTFVKLLKMSGTAKAPKKAAILKKKALRGFTLVELIVVITILAILATVGFLALSGYSQDAKSASVTANVRSIMTAISSESAVTGNSPRYYVVHDTGAALSGAVVYLDGNPTVLSGGNWNVAGTNYSAGNPDYVKLKLNPEKFKIASLPFFETAHAAYDPKNASV